MNRKKIFVPLLLLVVVMASCMNVKEKRTSLEITDNYRHYYPVLQGQMLDIVFPVKNIGENPFILEDIITSCGCLTVQKSSIKSIPAGAKGHLILKYNSNKNVGAVRHYVTLYGNFETTDKMEIVFDINVVPNSLWTKDYEELYQEEKDKGGRVKNAVDGNENNKGYYMPGDFD
ncbi:MAG: DUF1573 domain-containing protein [Bacteroidetes bacterium]|nr:DUF1573 domain-containing protein [Bacteroidota bacterium]